MSWVVDRKQPFRKPSPPKNGSFLPAPNFPYAFLLLASLRPRRLGVCARNIARWTQQQQQPQLGEKKPGELREKNHLRAINVTSTRVSKFVFQKKELERATIYTGTDSPIIADCNCTKRMLAFTYMWPVWNETETNSVHMNLSCQNIGWTQPISCSWEKTSEIRFKGDLLLQNGRKSIMARASLSAACLLGESGGWCPKDQWALTNQWESRRLKGTSFIVSICARKSKLVKHPSYTSDVSAGYLLFWTVVLLQDTER